MFLEATPPRTKCNASDVFKGLVKKDERYFLASMDSWINGNNCKTRYHGWDKSEHGGEFKRNFVFKRNDDGRRFYGALCHPIKELPRCEVCILIMHVFKSDFKIEPSHLKMVNDIFNLFDAQKAIVGFFTHREVRHD